ncbi:MAG: LAGLIDADG family homing endonuclease [Patescibacteria group bacterium]
MEPTKPPVPSPTLALYQKQMGIVDIVAPESLEVDFDYLKIDNVYFRTLFVAGYPRFVSPGWLEPVINFDSSLDISFYIYPVEGKSVLDDLRRKIAEMEAEIATDLERGKIVDPSTQAKLEDARALQEQLVKGSERFFEFSFYITIPANSIEELNHITRQVESTLGSLLIVAKHATLDQPAGFLSSAPFGVDRLAITRNMDTTSLATTFPLTSAELSSDRGVLYGINSENESFIIFDRFSLENSNMTIFATSGAGKSTSYATEVLYQDERGITRKEKIGKLVDGIFATKSPIKLEKEIEGVVQPGIKIFSFDENLGCKWSEVEIAARKISPQTLYRIKTKSGREIEITKDHCLVRLKEGKIKTTKGEAVRIGNYLPLPRKIAYAPSQAGSLDAFEILKNSQLKFLRKMRGRVGNRLIRRTGGIPATIALDKDFFLILGLLASEGMVAHKRVLITSTTPAVLKEASKYFASLGVHHRFIKRAGKIFGVNVTSETLSSLFKEIGAAGKAADKKVPDVVFSASNNHVANFLSAYFEGDGTVSEHELSATTKSKQLASGICYLLSRFGIIARTSVRRKMATNTKARKKEAYYNTIISGRENIETFLKEIGFLSKEKTLKASKLLKAGNTNVDVVPELGSIFREIYQELYGSELPAPNGFSEIKLGIFRPSRKNLSRIIAQIKRRIDEIEGLEGDGLSKLRKLPTIGEIIESGKDRKTNSLLWKKLGASWQTIKSGIKPNTRNALLAAQITHSYQYGARDVGAVLYQSFKYVGVSLQKYDSPLWSTILYKKANSRYEKVIKARDYITEVYKKKLERLQVVKQKVRWLETLANSDLFWDPVVSVKKIKSKHKYVYDLQVKNRVFLAGHAGMFVHNSYFVKLEALRSLMLGTEVIVIDPESEYKTLSRAVGGEFISFSFNSPSKINPFDLSQVYEEGENQLGLKILSLHSLFKVIMGTITPSQEALLDRALVATYRGKGITQDPTTQKREPPLMEDLYKTLVGMETSEAMDLAARIEKFVRGSFVGIFDKQTNVDIRNPFTVFSVKDLQDVLRPIAMFVILDFIWTRVKKDLKKRLLIVDEAWHMMRYPDSAQFLWSVVKRARKYFLGLTTITQDVEDFLAQDIGKAIVTNSALQLLLKQSPAAIDKVSEVFYLSQGEKQLLLAANVGEGIFFAGPHHAPIRVVSSEEEHTLITTKPQK